MSDFYLSIEGLPHLILKDVRGLHSWIEDQDPDHPTYHIDFHLAQGGVVNAWYDKRPLWEEVLKAFERQTSRAFVLVPDEFADRAARGPGKLYNESQANRKPRGFFQRLEDLLALGSML